MRTLTPRPPLPSPPPSLPGRGGAKTKNLAVFLPLSRRGRAGGDGRGGWGVRVRAGALLALLAASPAFAHANHRLDASTVFSWWTWDPFVILLLAVSGALYA